LLEAVDGPVVAPSANLAGQASPRDAQDVLDSLDGRIDLLLDGGPTRYGADSTIVRFDPAGRWNLLRKGVYDQRMIERLLGWTIIFVCTGNTCRSPLGAALAVKMLAERQDVLPKDLVAKGFEVLSAGLFAADGLGATPEACEAAEALGAKIGQHRSQRLTSELIHRADLLFCMTESHVQQVLRMAPWAASKVRRLASQDISDPIGGGSEQYRRTAEQIQQALQESLDRELP
jgi:protein-tyrosine phosphatase